ncbi:MAG: SDR family NAD(P)-dependent oxidoreductase, partial [Chthoniobacterales bacterium]
MTTKKIALVTGANKGIGLETVRQLAGKEMTVLLGARDMKKGEEAAEKLRKEKLDVRALEIDVSNSASIQKAAKEVEREFGQLDILINNAGVMLDDEKKMASEQSLETWRKTFETNLFGLIETTNAFLPLLRKSEAGRIVNLSSILGSITYHATPGSPVYDSKSY